MDVSVIILNYNSSRYTLDCIESIQEKETGSLKYEIIVVDNNSINNELNLLDKNLPANIHLVKCNVNYGFGGGNLQGVHQARGKYLAFLNNDTYFKNACLSDLFYYMEKNQQVGVVAPQQWNVKNQKVYSFDCFHGIRRFFIGSRPMEIFFKKPARIGRFNQPIQVDFVQGSFMFFNAAAYKQVGGFDPNIFLYYEEMDICKRLKKEGFSSVFFPNTNFVHYHEVSTSKHFSASKKKEILLSYLYVLRKDFGFVRYFVIKNLLTCIYLFKSIIAPKKFKILKMLLFFGSPLSHSLRHKQKIK